MELSSEVISIFILGFILFIIGYKIFYVSGLYISRWEYERSGIGALSKSQNEKEYEERSKQEIRERRLSQMNWISVIFSVILLVSAIYIILSLKYDDSVEKWAFGIIGTIIGYWGPQKPEA